MFESFINLIGNAFNAAATFPSLRPLFAALNTIYRLVGASSVLYADVADDANLAGNYANGTLGVGATLTKASAGAFPTIDGVTPVLGMAVLLTAQTTGAQNGLYTLTRMGDASVAWQLTRFGGWDQSAEMVPGSLFAVRQGTVYAGKVFSYVGSSSPTVGTTALPFIADALMRAGQGASITYSGANSLQPLAADLNVGAGVGRDAPDTAFIAAVMGNILGAALTKTGNYIAGTIGALSVTGANAARFGVGGVLGIIMDTVTIADAAVLAVLDGDSGQTNAEAMFGVKSNNSTAASGTNFGLNLMSAAHDGFLAVNAAFFKKAEIQLPNNICIRTGTGAPVDGTTGDNVLGRGSLYVNEATGEWYINTGTITDSTWKLVTHA